MKVQIADAFAIFTDLASRVMIPFDLKLYMPISLVERNWKIGKLRNSVGQETLYFGKHIFADKSHVPNSFKDASGRTQKPKFSSSVREYCISSCCFGSEWELMNIDQIIVGKSVNASHKDQDFSFPGLILLVKGYLDAIDLPIE
ncbi:Glutamate--cysteine ligase [Galdieria sulphuraria]|nr:Glutamate--cysteine ligase [Galdieria sulphuraria]